ncbi:hypothetical protein DLAC_10597 [Tieghemostelium lacteum]|uniref:Tyrosine specific protein phosphatases domain-containing protein n=1 Tax=Tieghemostelium lacteum TaxID=361077 RepID=A0A151Z4A7_TIELA|nr:hypothetical protein DLAC_10597 [Tieghemostelium lacteum]|eukprot:KYQ88800.1 hypothetical protein DLAC_10597 [Tieghemostelium lacteum]
MIQIKCLPPRWHIIGKDGICCNGNCKKNLKKSLNGGDGDEGASTQSSSSLYSSGGMDELSDDDNMRGPLDICNWVVKNKIMSGENPANTKDQDHFRNLSTLLDSGINVFVCLQETQELTNFREYKNDVLTLAKQKGISTDTIEFLNFPIEDGCAANSLEELGEFIDLLLQKLQDNKNCFLHCHAGRGRTGIIAACLLGRLYQVSGLEALRRTQACYEQRIIGWGESPEYHPQKMQVIRYLKLIEEKQSQPKQQLSLSSSS